MSDSTVCMNETAGIEETNSANETTQTPDPFDVARLTLSQDFQSAAGVKKVLNMIPVRKPSKEWFVQTHPDTSYHINTCVIDLKEDNELFLVDPSLWDLLAGESTFGP